MSSVVNRQWRVVRRPVGNIREDDFELTETPLPTLEQGQVLVRISDSRSIRRSAGGCRKTAMFR